MMHVRSTVPASCRRERPVRGLALCAAALLLFCGALAEAGPMEFGPEGGRFSVEVPADWQIAVRDAHDGALNLVSADGKAAVSVRVCAREGRRVEALARRTASNLSVSGVRRQDDSTWMLYVTSENVRVRNLLQSAGESILVISLSGESEMAQAVAASIRPLP